MFVMEKMARVRLSDHYKTLLQLVWIFILFCVCVLVLVWLFWGFLIPRNKGTIIKSLALRWKWAYLSFCVN